LDDPTMPDWGGTGCRRTWIVLALLPATPIIPGVYPVLIGHRR